VSRAGLRLVLVVLLASAGCRSDAPDVAGAVVIVLDTLRADRLGAYGNARSTSPAIDALAAEGVLFEQALTPCSWTLPAMASLLSGRELGAPVFAGELRASLVERLRDAGIETAAFTEGGYVSAYFGIDRGFEVFEEREGPVRLVRPDGRPVSPREGDAGIEQTFARAREWLRGRDGGRFFLLVHSYEVHAPYRSRTFTEGRPRGALGPSFELADVGRLRAGELVLGPDELDHLLRLYDGGVRRADEQVAGLLATLAELGLAGRTLVVVTADHGEDLGERDRRFAGDHGHALYEEQVRVPLVLRDPGLGDAARGRRVREAVSLADVLPTVLERLSVPLPAGLDGRSLVPLARGEPAPPARSLLLRLFPRRVAVAEPSRIALHDGRYKLIVNSPFLDPPAPSVELFDLASDPGERDNRADRDPDRRDRMVAELRARTAALEAAGLPDLSGPGAVPAGVRERLESLGYAQ
jgi:arylsulfatase A-like enzyme